MASIPPRTERRRARPGSLQRPVNGRLYRGTWMLVGLPLLRGSLQRRAADAAPSRVPPGLRRRGDQDTRERTLPGPSAYRGPWRRRSGSGHSFSRTGCRSARRRFSAEIPGLGKVHPQNMIAEAAGRSPRHDRRDGTSRQRRNRARCERQRVRDGDVDPARPRLRGTARSAVRTTAPEPHDSLRVDRRRRIRRA